MIFNNDTRAGRIFDAGLILMIIGSITVVMLGSVRPLEGKYGALFTQLEVAFTTLFAAEYLLRLLSARHASHYARSFFGVIDLLSVLPGVVGLLLPGRESLLVQSLLVIRIVRLVRVFRILHLGNYLTEARVLSDALRASTAKITVFLLVVLVIVVLMGTAMFLIEGPNRGFTSIPTSVYWAIVTLTTVGYGDISPQTPLGKALASLLMILGYGIIAVPTGLITVGLAQARLTPETSPASAPGVSCQRCGSSTHLPDARYCSRCGEGLLARQTAP
ncbi:ion transporter [Deinococcus altitudinis]|uniref:ion transporter n=1 Tax=Deinococcus altitudinis TaxID=468914 RepID=UPI0038919408